MKQLNAFLETIVKVLKIRIGKRQTFVTVINEEALLSAKYPRDERKEWNPRICARTRKALLLTWF